MVPAFLSDLFVSLSVSFRDVLIHYTPGQKFIEFFFNELLHQDNGEYQQFVNSGMETYHFSKHLWNIVCVGALVTVQCP